MHYSGRLREGGVLHIPSRIGLQGDYSGTAAPDKQLVNMVRVEHIAYRMTDSQVPHLFGSALERQFCYIYSFGPLN